MAPNKAMDSIALICSIITIAALITGIFGEDGTSATFTEKEKEAIAQLRSEVEDKLTHDFMKTDEYLMRWLTSKKMDIKRAQEGLETSLKWRKENNIDDIMTEDFGTFPKQFPVHTYGIDKGGHPILAIHFGHWVIRKAAQNAQIPQLVRYMIKNIMEQGRIKAEELSKAAGTQNSRYVLLVDLSGYNLKEHACLQCFGLYTKFVQLYEDNYPEGAYKVMIINAPTIFETIMELIRPIMSPASKRDLSLQGVRKAEWAPSILKLIDADQIPPQYGGNKKFAG